MRSEHTPFQWASQRALYDVAVWGDRRSDLRVAIQTANLIAAQQAEPVPDEEFREMVRSMSSYMPGESSESEDDIFDAAALAVLKKGGMKCPE